MELTISHLRSFFSLFLNSKDIKTGNTHNPCLLESQSSILVNSKLFFFSNDDSIPKAEEPFTKTATFFIFARSKDKNSSFSIQRQKDVMLYILKSSEGLAFFSCLDIRYVFNTSLWVIMIRNCNSPGKGLLFELGQHLQARDPSSVCN